MKKQKKPFFIIVFCLFSVSVGADEDMWKALQSVERTIPSAFNHPGNVFLEKEALHVAVPESAASFDAWRIFDDRKTVVMEGDKSGVKDGRLISGELGIGWYRIEFLDKNQQILDWTTAAVLAEFKSPVPQDSPICLDGAISWFAQNDPVNQANMARLAALAGVNWFRDRLRWRDLEPQPGKFAEHGNYDIAAEIQRDLGLKVLQVFHDTPPWARQASWDGGFPIDLRQIYNFSQAMSTRFQGSVQAWEPWNEANAHNFGGHPFHEIIALQKAAYLGFKAGDSNVTVGFNAYCGVPTSLYARMMRDNGASAYFDTYNFHSYNWPHSFENLWGPIWQVACGKPVWLTETDRGMEFDKNSPHKDFTFSNEMLKAQYIPQEYAFAMWNGVHRIFHFILGEYSESGKIQFGLLRMDLTPRPGYVTLAAMGRLLAGARCLGRVENGDESNVHCYAFRAEPDGIERDVLMVWAEKSVDWPYRGKTMGTFRLPADVAVMEVVDYMGRFVGDTAPLEYSAAPVYLVCAKGAADHLQLQAPKTSSPCEETMSSVVLHSRFPKSQVKKIEEVPWSEEWDVVIPCGEWVDVPVDVYNFHTRKVKGTVQVAQVPEGWKIKPRSFEVSLDSMGHLGKTFSLWRPPAEKSEQTDPWIQWQGNFGNAGTSRLALRLVAYPGEGYGYDE
jgi:hypothetical protein